MGGVTKGLTFSAWSDGAFVPPVAVLEPFRPLLDTGDRWQFAGAEFATGFRHSARLNALTESGEPVTTETLFDLISDGIQMVGGSVAGWRSEDPSPFLQVVSIRGDDWDVMCELTEFLDAVRRRFPGAVPLPDR